METDILKHFIGKDVEILVSGVWIEGHMQPIAKGIVTLIPIGEAGAFYGPAACKTDVIQAIRQVIRSGIKMANPVPEINQPPAVRSSMESITPGQRFKRKE
jgi:hypothetical protein